MEVRNCRNCGRLFNYIGGAPLCPSCTRELDEKFSVVKEYIYNNPKATIQEIADDNDVSIPQINKWIREERLCFSQDSVVGVNCENCGAMIRTGRFCPACKEKLASSLGNAYHHHEEPAHQKDQRDNPRMRFLDN